MSGTRSVGETLFLCSSNGQHDKGNIGLDEHKREHLDGTRVGIAMNRIHGHERTHPWRLDREKLDPSWSIHE